MLDELYKIFPVEIVFQILTYRPHKNAEMIKEFWRIHYLWKRMHNIGMRKVDEEMTNLTAEMREAEEEVGADFGGFYGYYMYNQSPQQFNNIADEMDRNGYWYE